MGISLLNLVAIEWEWPFVSLVSEKASKDGFVWVVDVQGRRLVVKARMSSVLIDLETSLLVHSSVAEAGFAPDLVPTRNGHLFCRFGNFDISVSLYAGRHAARKYFSVVYGLLSRLGACLAVVHHKLNSFPKGGGHSFLFRPPSLCPITILHKLLVSFPTYKRAIVKSYYRGAEIAGVVEKDQQWIHGDVRPKNICLDSMANISFIDFDNSSYYAREYEIARCYLCCLPQERFRNSCSSSWLDYYDSYSKVFPVELSPQEVLEYYIYIALSSVAQRVGGLSAFSSYDMVVLHRCCLAVKSF